MQFQFSFRHMDTSPALQNYAEEKLREKIDKFVTKPIEAHVFFSVVRHQHAAHFKLNAGDGFSVDVEHQSQDMYATIDEMADKLEAQLRKHKEKLKDHKLTQLPEFREKKPIPEDAVDAAEILKFEAGRKRANGR
jgi:putative sigma-54 modulation protein